MTTSEKAQKMISERTTDLLVADFNNTSSMQMTPELAVVRGWIMDELEKRNPEAFSAWIDSDESDPLTFYF